MLHPDQKSETEVLRVGKSGVNIVMFPPNPAAYPAGGMLCVPTHVCLYTAALD